MHLLCPHCHNPLQPVGDAAGWERLCPSCGTALRGTPEVVLRRRRTTQVLCALAAAICTGSFFLEREAKGIAPALLAVAAAAGFLGGGLVLPFLRGADGGARWAACYFMGILFSAVHLAASAELRPEPALMAGGVILAAVFIALYELGLTIHVRADGLGRSRKFPLRSFTFIPWDKVETVRADFRVHDGEESHLAIEGEGKRIRLNTMRYRGSQAVVGEIVARAEPAAVAWTLREIETRGSANLGAVRLFRDKLAWSRAAAHGSGGGMDLFLVLVAASCTLGLFPLVYGIVLLARAIRGCDEVPLAGLRGLRLEAGSLVVERPAGTRTIPVRRIRNGLYLLRAAEHLQRRLFEAGEARGPQAALPAGPRLPTRFRWLLARVGITWIGISLLGTSSFLARNAGSVSLVVGGAGVAVILAANVSLILAVPRAGFRLWSYLQRTIFAGWEIVLLEQPSTPGPGRRAVRIFVSSTFRDMQGEREELVKHVFPQLRKLCESRGVSWAEVDLRWGITEQQAERGEVLPICLAEIDRCRPYFLCLLGERYGWVPGSLPHELLEQYPWLGEYAGRSVTELEAVHAALRDVQAAGRAFFYFRDPSYAEKAPPERESDYRERSPDARAKLAALKESIRGSGLPVREDYPDPQALGQLVLSDLSDAIGEQYPAGPDSDPLDREAAEHEAFARSRLGVYVGRKATFHKLEAHARGNGPPLVVVGEPGSGKSALLANWALRCAEAHRDTLVVTHFIGASAQGTDWAAMLRRIMGEVQRRFALEQEMPDEPDALRLAFARCLSAAAARGRVVLVIDALDQLDGRGGALDLAWLPPAVPCGVRLIVSTLPGRPLQELMRRGWPRLSVEPLWPRERRRLIVEYLRRYAKELVPSRVKRIAAARQAANPLFLRALLDELRVFGAHEGLGQRIGDCLGASTLEELFQRILARYEQDYERDRPGLVREAMSLLWAARRGLSEAELLDLLGAQGAPLPRAHWSPLYLAAERSLAGRSGLLGFAHEFLRQAVQNRYLSTPEARQAAHLRLADYFTARAAGARKVEELPWQLAAAESWERLSALLSDLPFFAEAWRRDSFSVRASWARLETHSPFRMVVACRPVVEDPAAHRDCAAEVASLLDRAGHLAEALPLWRFLSEEQRRAGDWENYCFSIGSLASAVHRGGDLDAAMPLYRSQEEVCRQLGNRDSLQACLGNQGVLLHARGNLAGALALYKQQEQICRELGKKDGLQTCLGNQGRLLAALRDFAGALALYKQQEQICRELGLKDGLANALGNQAEILTVRGDWKGVLALSAEEEQICRELGNKDGLRGCLGRQARILQSQGDLYGATVLNLEARRLAQGAGHKGG